MIEESKLYYVLAMEHDENEQRQYIYGYNLSKMLLLSEFIFHLFLVAKGEGLVLLGLSPAPGELMIRFDFMSFILIKLMLGYDIMGML